MSPRKSNGKKKKTSPRRKLKNTSRRRRLRFDTDTEGNITKRTVEIEPPTIPEPTEQEKNIYTAIEEAFQLGDDAARAVARFERDVVLPRYRENDESEEEFRKEEMEAVMGHLGHIHMIKAMLPFYGLQDYEKQIVGHFITQLFGPTRSGPPQTIFRGGDEAYLQRMVMTTD